MAILIVFADLKEAHSSLKQLDAKHIQSNLYEFAQGYIVISGWGIHNALLTVSHYHQKIDEIWNLGLAGALNDQFEIGSLLPIKTIDKFLSLPNHIDPLSNDIASDLFPSLSVAPEGGRLITTDFPIHDADIRKKLTCQWDFIDMEGYGIASAAHYFKKTCKIWKIVSDFASKNGRTLIRQNMPLLSELLAKEVVNNLSQYKI